MIIVSWIGGLKASGVIGAYNISKAADFQLARNLAAEFGPSQVRVNCIAPGLIRTDFARALIFFAGTSASARRRCDIDSPSMPSPPTFKAWRRLMALAWKLGQACDGMAGRITEKRGRR